MTTFKATVKKPRSDGFYTVYIRVTHQRKTSYIKTNKIIDPAHITSSGELTDPVVNEYCAIIIRQYTDKLNRVDATFWELKDVIELLNKYIIFVWQINQYLLLQLIKGLLLFHLPNVIF